MVLIGEGVAAFEKSILAEPEAKADERVVLYGHKIWAWAAWALLARANVKEAHEGLGENKAPEESADKEAALEEESSSKATYEERVKAWTAQFGKKAQKERAEMKSAKVKAAPARIFRSKGLLRKIELLQGERMGEVTIDNLAVNAMNYRKKGSDNSEYFHERIDDIAG